MEPRFGDRPGFVARRDAVGLCAVWRQRAGAVDNFAMGFAGAVLSVAPLRRARTARRAHSALESVRVFWHAVRGQRAKRGVLSAQFAVLVVRYRHCLRRGCIGAHAFGGVFDVFSLSTLATQSRGKRCRGGRIFVLRLFGGVGVVADAVFDGELAAALFVIIRESRRRQTRAFIGVGFSLRAGVRIIGGARANFLLPRAGAVAARAISEKSAGAVT